MLSITSGWIESYVGGQIETLDRLTKTFERGEIKSILLEEGYLKIEFVWLAKLIDGEWVKIDTKTFMRPILRTMACELNNGEFMLVCPIVSGCSFVFPPDGEKLELTDVKEQA